MTENNKHEGFTPSDAIHDMRNALTGIRGFASLLEKDLENNPDLKKMATKILQASDRLANQLKEFSELFISTNKK